MICNIPSSPAYGVFISQLIQYARAWSSYQCFIPRVRWRSSKLPKQGYFVERFKSSFRPRVFYGRQGDLIQQYKVSLLRMLNDILTIDKLQWLPNLSDLLSISWLRYQAWPSPNYDWFHGGFATGVTCKHGTLTLPDTWFCLFLGHVYASIVGPSFSELVVSFLDCSPRLSFAIGTFLILFVTNIHIYHTKLNCKTYYIILMMLMSIYWCHVYLHLSLSEKQMYTFTELIFLRIVI